MDFFPQIELSRSEAEAIAQGLYAVARCDGLHPREGALIADFYQDAVAGEDTTAALTSLERLPEVTGAQLAAQLGRKEVRQLFVKSAWLLAYADGSVSAAERAKIGTFAQALELGPDESKRLEEGVKDFLLGQLTHLQNVDAARAVARKLG
jgi:tellurite resistance protein